ncbi:hypothetical protein [Chryseobacterium sp. T1]
MSRKTDANRKEHKKKIDNKKRKLQDAEIERKKRLKEINQQFNNKQSSDN